MYYDGRLLLALCIFFFFLKAVKVGCLRFTCQWPFLCFVFKKQQNLSGFSERRAVFYRGTAIKMALTKPRSSSLYPGHSHQWPAQELWVRCAATQRTVIYLPLVGVPSLSLPLSCRCSFEQIQHSPNDDLLRGYLIRYWKTLFVSVTTCHPVKIPAHALQSSSESRLWVCQALARRDSVWGRWGMGCCKAGDRASAQFQQAPGVYSSCQKRFCWVVVVFTVRWMAPVEDQENCLHFPLPAWGICVSIPMLELVWADVIFASASVFLPSTCEGKAVLLIQTIN